MRAASLSCIVFSFCESGLTARNASFKACGMLTISACLMNSQSCGCAPSRLVKRGREHQLAYQLRMPDRDLQCDARAVAEAEEDRLARSFSSRSSPATSSAEPSNVERLIAIGGASVALFLERNHPAGAGKKRENRPKFESIVEPPP